MAEPFVIFDGSPGSHISTEDINILEADLAHCQQSVVGWVSGGGMENIRQSTDIAPVFGDFHGAYTSTTDGVAFVIGGRWNFHPTSIPGNALITGIASLAGVTAAGSTFEIRFSWVDASGASLGTSDVTQIPMPSEFTEVVLQATSPSTAAFTQLQLIARDVEIGDELYFDACMVAEGSYPTFVPSLRIVGTLGETIDPVDMPIGYAADGTPLTVGDSWLGDGYRYTRMDGAVGVGPVVADFNPADIVLP